MTDKFHVCKLCNDSLQPGANKIKHMIDNHIQHYLLFIIVRHPEIFNEVEKEFFK